MFFTYLDPPASRNTEAEDEAAHKAGDSQRLQAEEREGERADAALHRATVLRCPIVRMMGLDVDIFQTLVRRNLR